MPVGYGARRPSAGYRRGRGTHGDTRARETSGDGRSSVGTAGHCLRWSGRVFGGNSAGQTAPSRGPFKPAAPVADRGQGLSAGHRCVLLFLPESLGASGTDVSPAEPAPVAGGVTSFLRCPSGRARIGAKARTGNDRATAARGRRSPVRWRVRWDADGRARNKTLEREEDARRFRVHLERDMAAGSWIDPASARVTVWGSGRLVKGRCPRRASGVPRRDRHRASAGCLVSLD